MCFTAPMMACRTCSRSALRAEAWEQDLGLHAVSVIAGTLTVHSVDSPPVSYGPGQHYVAGWAPYLTVNDGTVPVAVVVTRLAQPGPTTEERNPTRLRGGVLDRFSTAMARITPTTSMRGIHVRGRVRILTGMVLVTALWAPSGPSAAGEGDHGGKIVFSRLVSGVPRRH